MVCVCVCVSACVRVCVWCGGSIQSGGQHAAADDVSGAVAPDGEGGVAPQLVRVAPLQAGLRPPAVPLQPLRPPAAGDPEPAPPP